MQVWISYQYKQEESLYRNPTGRFIFWSVGCIMLFPYEVQWIITPIYRHTFIFQTCVHNLLRSSCLPDLWREKTACPFFFSFFYFLMTLHESITALFYNLQNEAELAINAVTVILTPAITVCNNNNNNWSAPLDVAYIFCRQF